MKILVSNLRLKNYGGSEIWTYQIVEELLRLGHEVELYTLLLGDIYERLLKLGATRLHSKKFDLAILNHYDCIENISGLKLDIAYKIQTCHGIYPPPEQPHKLVHEHIAVSEEVQAHLLSTSNIVSSVSHNPCNLTRYKSTKAVNNEVKNVLILCVGVAAQNKSIQACKILGLKYEVRSKWHKPVFDLERKINDFDLCIGYGRGVIESICCGRNVIVYDSRRYMAEFADGLLTKDTFNKSLSCNFSGRASKLVYSISDIITDIKHATKQNADFIYMQRKRFDVQDTIKHYITNK